MDTVALAQISKIKEEINNLQNDLGKEIAIEIAKQVIAPIPESEIDAMFSENK